MILQSLNQGIKEAIKARNQIRLSTLRLLSSSLNYEKIAKQHELNEQEEITVVRREIKKRLEAIDFLKKAQEKGSTSDPETLKKRLEQEETELGILKEFLPSEMDDKELEKLVDEVLINLGAKSIKDMGRVIGEVIKKAKGSVEGRRVAEIVKSKLV